MKKITLFLTSALISVSALALEPLADQELQKVQGQAGADLSLKLSLNHNPLTDLALQDGTKPTFNCASDKLAFCRLAISPNKRYVNFNTTTNKWEESSESGNKLWLVAKGIQGTINLQLLGLDGAKLDKIFSTSGGAYTADINKAAIQLTAKAALPIQIRDFGYDALSIERDTFTTNNAGVEAGSTDPNAYGYLKVTTYDSTDNSPTNTAFGSTFDNGRETGFMGLRMNGNLALQGKIFMYSCTGTSSTRC